MSEPYIRLPVGWKPGDSFEIGRPVRVTPWRGEEPNLSGVESAGLTLEALDPEKGGPAMV